MSTETAGQDRPAPAATDAAGTGVFLPGATDSTDVVQPAAAIPAPAPAATDADGTGVYLPAEQAPGPAATDADGTGVFLPGATDGTGVFLPAAPAPAPDVTYKDATRVFPPGQPSPTDATGMYVPGQIGTPGARMLEGTGVFDPSACDVAAPTGARGKADPTAPRCGRYVLKRFHARGGMGEIWMAEDPGIGRSVALKRMLGPRPDMQRRFLTEAQVTGQLEHPGIVPIHELGVNEEGQPFYVMKFVRPDLAEGDRRPPRGKVGPRQPGRGAIPPAAHLPVAVPDGGVRPQQGRAAPRSEA